MLIFLHEAKLAAKKEETGRNPRVSRAPSDKNRTTPSFAPSSQRSCPPCRLNAREIPPHPLRICSHSDFPARERRPFYTPFRTDPRPLPRGICLRRLRQSCTGCGRSESREAYCSGDGPYEHCFVARGACRGCCRQKRRAASGRRRDSHRHRKPSCGGAIAQSALSV